MENIVDLPKTDHLKLNFTFNKIKQNKEFFITLRRFKFLYEFIWIGSIYHKYAWKIKYKVNR